MARPKVHDDALRLRLIDLAAAVVFDGGVDALGLRGLAAAAGTSTSAVYSLFGSKSGLLEALYLEAARRFGAHLATVPVTEDAMEDVVRLGIAYREYALVEPHLYSIMFSVPAEPNEDAAATIEPLVAAVGRGQRAGQLRAAPTGRIALACWAVAHGLVSIELTGNVPPGLDIADGYEEALRAMILGWRDDGRDLS